jgi:hypothetical protein
MGFIKSDAIHAPALASETVPVAELAGDVRVRSMLLSERLGIEQRIVALRKATTDKGDAGHSDWLAIVPDVLAMCVLDGDNRPVFSRAKWENFGSANLSVCVQLFNVAWRLSGFDGESTDPKN